MLMIDQNLYHIIKDQISEKDPKQIYKELLSHFDGNKQHHIEHAEVTLESHIINANEITLSISVFREKLLAFEDAQESGTTEPYRIALLKKSMTNIKDGYSSDQYKFASMSGYTFNKIL